MAKHKKRKLESISQDPFQMSVSPPVQRARKHKSPRLSTPSAKTLDQPNIVDRIHTPQRSRSNNPSPSDKGQSPRCSTSSKSQLLSSRKHNVTLPLAQARLGSNTRRSSTPQSWQDFHTDIHKQKPNHFKIVPPIDPKKTITFLDAVYAQNRHKSQCRQTFASLPSDTDSDSSSASADEASAALSREILDDETQNDATTSSDTNTSSSTSSDSDSDSDDKQKLNTESKLAKDKRQRSSRKVDRRKPSKSTITPVTRSTALTEKPRPKEIKETAKAAKRGTLRYPKNHNHQQTSKSYPDKEPHSTAITTRVPPHTLSRTDRTQLKALHSLIPTQILTHARHKLQPDETHPSDTSITLTAARDLILHLSGRKLLNRIPPNGSFRPLPLSTANAAVDDDDDSNASRNGYIQGELLRIVQQREMRIDLLEREIWRLRQSK